MQGKVYTVFGLGNSCYTKFCGAAVLMDRLAEQAGGKRMLEVYKVCARKAHERFNFIS